MRPNFIFPLKKVRHIIVGFIDFVHKPFSRWIDTQTFRYLACGGSNAMLDVLVYWISLHYILPHYTVPLTHVLPVVGIHDYIAAYMMSFSISFPLGFTLSKYIVFPESNLHGHKQFFRYAVLVIACIGLNYVFLKLFIGIFVLPPILSKILTTAIVAIFSYFSQRKFTFKMIVE